MKGASGKILARDNRFIWKAMPPSKKLLRSGEEKVFSWFSVVHQVKNAYDILEMPTAWGNWVTCHDLHPACPSRDERKNPTIFLELFIVLLCKGLSMLGWSACWGTGCPGGFGLEAHEGNPSCGESSYPSSIPSWRKGNWKDLSCIPASHGDSYLAVLHRKGKSWQWARGWKSCLLLLQGLALREQDMNCYFMEWLCGWVCLHQYSALPHFESYCSRAEYRWAQAILLRCRHRLVGLDCECLEISK